MTSWRCTLCGYEYHPEDGDLENDIDIDTAFEDLPVDWACPDCGASQEDFDEMEPNER